MSFEATVAHGPMIFGQGRTGTCQGMGDGAADPAGPDQDNPAGL